MAEQTYATHRKFVPLYHFVISTLLTLNFIWSLYRLFRGFPEVSVPFFDRLLSVLVAVALLLIFYYTRVFPLRAQDRIIRLEEILRMERLLPADLQPRIGELSSSQLIALRFASDEELPELIRAVLDRKIAKRDEIKRMVRTWRADHRRM